MPTEAGRTLVHGGFDDLRSDDVRFLQEAARLGPVEVLLLSDRAIEGATGRPPAFPEEERLYVVEAIRYVSRVTLVEGPIGSDPLALQGGEDGQPPGRWAVREAEASSASRSFCASAGLGYAVIPDSDLEEFPGAAAADATPGSEPRKKALVTGCYDWLHSGHVRFFEEVSELADLYVTVGSDRNIEFLKGEGHPLYPEEERRYMVGSIRHVKRAMIATGWGWLDAEPEIERLRPDIYAVNEDGDRPEKREYCEAHGIDYRVLRRLPREGLPARQSTDFRDF